MSWKSALPEKPILSEADRAKLEFHQHLCHGFVDEIKLKVASVLKVRDLLAHLRFDVFPIVEQTVSWTGDASGRCQPQSSFHGGNGVKIVCNNRLRASELAAVSQRVTYSQMDQFVFRVRIEDKIVIEVKDPVRYAAMLPLFTMELADPRCVELALDKIVKVLRDEIRSLASQGLWLKG